MEREDKGFGADGPRRAAASRPRSGTDRPFETAAPAVHELHRLCVEEAPYGIMTHDPQGRIFLFNPLLEELTGFSRSEIPDVSSWIENLYPDPDYRALVLRARSIPTNEESIRTREAMITRKDGRLRMFRFISSALPGGFRLVYMRDIHESTVTPDAPLRAHQFSGDISAEASAPTFTYQRVGDDFHLIGYNQSAESLGGSDLPRCLAAKAADLYSTRPDILADIRRCLSARGLIRRRCTHPPMNSEPDRIFEATFRYRPPDSVVLRLEDLTPLRRVEEKLNESERKFIEFADLLPEIVFETDLEGRILFINRSGPALLGVGREQLLAKENPFSFVSPEDRPRAAANFRRVIGGEDLGPNEYRLMRADGSCFPALIRSGLILKDGRPAGARGFIIDVSDRKRAEEALRISERKFSTAFHAGAGAFAIATLRTGRFIDLNAGVCEMTGYSRKELLGESIYRLKIWADPADRHRLAQLLFEEGIVRSFDFRFRRKSGELRSGLISAALIELDGERCMISEAVDLTERHQAEAALQRAHDELEQRVQERTRELLKTNLKLEQQIERRRKVEEDLRAKEKQLKRKSADLLEVNSALKLLLRKREEDRREVEERISSHLNERVVPLLEKLKRGPQSPRQKVQLGVIEQNLRGLAAPFNPGITDKLYSFTPSEIQVANFIKLDKSNKEIAADLDVSVKTIEYHRYSIRRKLGLINKPINLRSFLKAMK